MKITLKEMSLMIMKECAFSEMEFFTQSFNDDVKKVEVSVV